jgi:hypothetical protein
MPQKPQKKPGPQFDAEPIDDDEQPPFTLDDDGEMTLKRKATKQPKKRRPQEAKRGK